MDPEFRDVPDELWAAVAPLLPPEPPKPKGGRPRGPDRIALAGILYRLRTGRQWHALPGEFRSGSTCHARFQEWAAALARRHIVAHIRRKGEPPLVGRVHGRPRRWVVERTNSWHNRLRALLIRWGRKADNHLAPVHLACAVIALRSAG